MITLLPSIVEERQNISISYDLTILHSWWSEDWNYWFRHELLYSVMRYCLWGWPIKLILMNNSSIEFMEPITTTIDATKRSTFTLCALPNATAIVSSVFNLGSLTVIICPLSSTWESIGIRQTTTSYGCITEDVYISTLFTHIRKVQCHNRTHAILLQETKTPHPGTSTKCFCKSHLLFQL